MPQALFYLMPFIFFFIQQILFAGPLWLHAVTEADNVLVFNALWQIMIQAATGKNDERLALDSMPWESASLRSISITVSSSSPIKGKDRRKHRCASRDVRVQWLLTWCSVVFILSYPWTRSLGLQNVPSDWTGGREDTRKYLIWVLDMTSSLNGSKILGKPISLLQHPAI